MSRGQSLGSDKASNSRDSKSDSSYERYKAKLHAIFDGLAPLPVSLREGADQTEEETELKAGTAMPAKSSRRLSQAQNSYSLFTEALTRAATHDEIRRAVDALKEADHPFPMDEDLLSKALTYPSEDVVLELLDKLESVLANSQPKNPRLLFSRLDDAAFSCRTGDARERIMSLKAKLKS